MGWPCGPVLKFACCASVAQSSPVWILGVDLHTAHQATLWQHPTWKNQNDIQLGYTTMSWGFGEEKKKEEDWQQMLAQGQSPSQTRQNKTKQNAKNK